MSTGGSPGRLRRRPAVVRYVGLLPNGEDKPFTPSSSDLEQVSHGDIGPGNVVTEKGIQTTHQDPQVARCVGVLMKGNNYRIKSTNPENEPGIDIGVEYVSWSRSDEDNCEENHKQLNKFEFEDGERMEFTVSSGKFLKAIKRMKKNKGYAVIIITKKPQDGFQWIPGREIELDCWTINKDIDDVSDDSSDYSDIIMSYTDAERDEIGERMKMQFIENEREAIERERCKIQRWIDAMGHEGLDEDGDLKFD